MHELSVCNALLGQVERVAAEHGASRVASITVRVGPLSGVEPDLLRNAYPIAAAGSIAESAELTLEPADIVVTCTACGRESPARVNRLLCGHCGDFRTRVVSGDELMLMQVRFGAQADASSALAG